MIINSANGDNWKKTLPEFTYTGQYEFINDGLSGGKQNWRIRFLTSGTLTFTKLGSAKRGIDVFCVGGGGAGGLYKNNSSGGGGGGYTSTTRGYPVNRTQYSIIIGAGGTAAWGVGGRGGTSSISALGASAAGGYGGGGGEGYNGGNGGSGGAAAGYWSAYGTGGSDGGNGSSVGPGVGGSGQGRTTREFGQSGATLYAGGGGNGVTWETDRNYNRCPGGSGGGGAGGLFSPIEETDFTLEAYAGTANTGGGGGGAAHNAQDLTYAGAGGSGIVIIRNAR